MMLRPCMRTPWLLTVLTLLVVGSATPDGRKGLFAVPAAEAASLAPASIPNEPAFDFAQLYGPCRNCQGNCFNRYNLCRATQQSNYAICQHRLRLCIQFCRRNCWYRPG